MPLTAKQAESTLRSHGINLEAIGEIKKVNASRSSQGPQWYKRDNDNQNYYIVNFTIKSPNGHIHHYTCELDENGEPIFLPLAQQLDSQHQVAKGVAPTASMSGVNNRHLVAASQTPQPRQTTAQPTTTQSAQTQKQSNSPKQAFYNQFKYDRKMNQMLLIKQDPRGPAYNGYKTIDNKGMAVGQVTAALMATKRDLPGLKNDAKSSSEEVIINFKDDNTQRGFVNLLEGNLNQVQENNTEQAQDWRNNNTRSQSNASHETNNKQTSEANNKRTDTPKL